MSRKAFKFFRRTAADEARAELVRRENAEWREEYNRQWIEKIRLTVENSQIVEEKGNDEDLLH